jgi:predicted amidophosphoribosyltransferase
MANEAKRYLYPNPKNGRLVSRQRLWQIRKRDEGLCTVCGKEADSLCGMCEEHYQSSLEYKTESRHRA